MIFIYDLAYYLFEEVQKETLQNDHTVIKLFNFYKSQTALTFLLFAHNFLPIIPLKDL